MRVSLGFVSSLLIVIVHGRAPIDGGRKPNIVLILTDDQDVELGSMNFMPNTLRQIRDEGAEMRHAYATTTVCCPSRSSLLTGRYVHNHGVNSNFENCCSREWKRDHESSSFGAYLSRAGYRTGYFGKYLNQYDGTYIPVGWNEWHGLVGHESYYNYTMNVNGRWVKHGYDYRKDYATDLIAEASVAFLRGSKNKVIREPVLLVVSFTAPHSSEESAPQFNSLFFNVSSHHTPAYDYAPNPDKQWILRATAKMQPIQRRYGDLLMAKRLQTLQSVDVAVERIIRTLEDLRELENTYVIYTSDHGYHIGQFGLAKGKGYPFEFDIRVPFFVRGPGIQPGSVANDIILNIDLGPTFLDLAGVAIPKHMDGISFKALFTTGSNLKRRDTFLIEAPRGLKENAIQATTEENPEVTVKKHCFEPNKICSVYGTDWHTPPLWSEKPICACINAENNDYTCIRTINLTHDFLYCRFVTGTRTFYDHEIDPFQLENRFAHLTFAEKSYLETKLDKLRMCKGARECTLDNVLEI